VKSFLHNTLLLILVLVLAGCTLPEVTPPPSPTAETQEPTSTEPVLPTVIPTTETSAAIHEIISSGNAANLQAVARSANSNVQFMTWAFDSRSITLVSQNSSETGDQIFGAASLILPSLNPGYVWAAPSGERILAASPDGVALAVLSSDMGKVAITDGALGSSRREITPGFLVQNGSFSPDGKTLALTDQAGWTVKLFSVTTGEEKATLTGFETAAPVFDAGFAGSDQWIVWHSRAKLQVQSVETGVLGKEFNHHDFVSAFTLSPDGKTLASSIFMPEISLWNVESGELIRTLAVENSATALSFSPDGKLLAAAVGNDIQILDVTNDTVLATLTDTPSPVYLVAFSPDGRMLASSGNDNQLIVWAVVK
jgi:Tol biopolymer transport system component